MSTGAQPGSGRRSEQATAERPTQFPQDAARDQSGRETAAYPETRPAQAPGVPGARGGHTRIGEGVVAKIAGLAARDIPGVFSMGSGVARRMGQLRNLIPGSSEAASQGVSVEV